MNPAAMALLAVAAILRGATQRGLNVPRRGWTPGGEHHGHGHGKGKLRKGTKPKVYPWWLVQEIPRGQLARRGAAGQELRRRPDGIWIYPTSAREEYEDRAWRREDAEFLERCRRTPRPCPACPGDGVTCTPRHRYPG